MSKYEGRSFNWQICDRCRGNGAVVHPALSVWTAEDRYEDPEGFEDMMNGAYDICCDECAGSGKVKVYVLTEEEQQEEYEAAMDDHHDRRTRAMEDGDVEAILNPEILNHYY